MSPTPLRPDAQALRELEEERARHIEALGKLELTDPPGVVAECHRYLFRVDEIMRASAERQTDEPGAEGDATPGA